MVQRQFVDNCQPKTAAFNFITWPKGLKQLKYLGLIAQINPRPIICNAQYQCPIHNIGLHMDDALVFVVMFYRVRKQVA